MRIAVVGAGAVGARVARSLAESAGITSVLIEDARPERAALVARSVGGPVEVCDDVAAAAPDLTVIAAAGGTHVAIAARMLDLGGDVVSTSDRMSDVRGLLDLDAEAKERGRIVATGVAFSPGLSCVLARHASREFDAVEEIHVARVGTGGPDCARQHHDALAGRAVDWRDGRWVERPGGSGRELMWFPEPIGPEDCYRASLPDARLLAPLFPGVVRITARLAANRRDRLTARLPMLRRPHPEGGLGALRVETRGRIGVGRSVKVLGAIERPAAGAALVAGVVSAGIAEDSLDMPKGAFGLAAIPDTVELLRRLREVGLSAATFEGAT